MKKATLYLNTGLFGKEAVSGYILYDLKVFKVVRYQTSWDKGSYYTWRTRVKLPWNAVEIK